MGTAQLGNLTFRIDPSQIQYAYQVDYQSIDTLGGQVIQVLGATTGDITIAGTFGQDHANNHLSWQLAETFHTAIRAMMDAQTLPSNATPGAPIHQPIRFTFADGVHNWDMKVLIKGINDLTGTGAIQHTNGTYSYGYTLTLFLVEDSSLLLSRIATDQYISRMASGVGWTMNDFSGNLDGQKAIDYIQKYSTDGTVDGYLAALLSGQIPQ
jgi:hypothetical protein